MGGGGGYYSSGVVPGVVPVFPGAAGLIFPPLFSGVADRMPMFPGPAVAGLSPRGPEGSALALCSACSTLIVSSSIHQLRKVGLRSR